MKLPPLCIYCSGARCEQCNFTGFGELIMTLPRGVHMTAEIKADGLNIITQGHPRVVIETAFATLSAEDRVACMRTLAHIHINQPTTFVTEVANNGPTRSPEEWCTQCRGMHLPGKHFANSNRPTWPFADRITHAFDGTDDSPLGV